MGTKKIVLALGFFDGVHLGHQELIKKAIHQAQLEQCSSGVLTFTDHPLTHIFPTYAPTLIMSNEDKIAKCKSLGIDEVYMENFDQKVMTLSPKEFVVDYLLKKFDLAHLVVGFDYTFGYKAAGNTAVLKQLGQYYGFGVTVIDELKIDGVPVSSSLIRQLIGVGKVRAASKYLGADHFIRGVVVIGKQLGSRFKLPTANLKMSPNLVLPSSGVYYTQIEIDGKWYDGATNLGINPTFKNHPYSIETYIYDFNRNIYGKKVKLLFKDKTRGEMKFDNIEDLFARIRRDIKEIDDKRLLKSKTNPL